MELALALLQPNTALTQPNNAAQKRDVTPPYPPFSLPVSPEGPGRGWKTHGDAESSRSLVLEDGA